MMQAFKQLIRFIASPFRFTVRFAVFVFAVAVALPVVAVQAQTEIVRVNIDNDIPFSQPDGESWTTAYQFLQDGLERADQIFIDLPETESVEIWVAAGTYLPNQGQNLPSFSDERRHAFIMRNNVALYGGFPPDAADSSYGPNGATFDDRDWEANPTILSGDLNGDDNVIIYDSETGELILEFENDNENNGQARSRNQATVGVTPLTAAERIDQTAIISGFTVRSTHRPSFIADGARLHVLNCVFSSSAPAAVHLRGGAEVVVYGCAFDATGVTISAADAATFHCVDDY